GNPTGSRDSWSRGRGRPVGSGYVHEVPHDAPLTAPLVLGGGHLDGRTMFIRPVGASPDSGRRSRHWTRWPGTRIIPLPSESAADSARVDPHRFGQRGRWSGPILHVTQLPPPLLYRASSKEQHH